MQLAFTQDLLQDLSSTLDTSSSGGESSDDEGERKEGIDEDDQAERAKLQQYASRFQVGVCHHSKFIPWTNDRLAPVVTSVVKISDTATLVLKLLAGLQSVLMSNANFSWVIVAEIFGWRFG